MQSAPLPKNEEERLAALKALDVLDSGPEAEFDALVRAASMVCETPISLISLVDTERQWFKAKTGLPEASETPRDIAFCAHAILSSGLFEVSDTLEDLRFHDNPLVIGKPDIRFYAGAPLVLSNGYAVGTLCVIDRYPKQLNVTQKAILNNLATVAVASLEHRKIIRREAQIHRDLINHYYSKSWLEAIVEHSNDAIISKDIKGHVTSWNHSAERIFGYSYDEMLGQFMTPLLPSNKLNEEVYLIEQLYAGKKISDFETIRLHKEGMPLYVSVSLSPIFDNAHNVIGISEIVRDISERKEAERIKSEFVSIVSHELRTPLTAIRGSLGLVLGAFSHDISDRVKKLLSIAYNNCERLIPLINDILDLDKIASGEMRFNMKDFSLFNLTQQAVQANEAYAQKFNVRVELHPISESIKINVDADRYLQVLANLLSNAAKFSVQDGLVTVFFKQKENKIRISVQDTGSGIPEEFRSRIFGKFSQAESTTVASKGGTGLGLHITKQIVEKMNGKIGFDTEQKQGTTFWVEFPIAIAS